VAQVTVDEIVLRLLPLVAVALGCLAVVTYLPTVTLGLRDPVSR
jgi:TRAP-type C4-dicarboxylate transport system permease large subunit